MKKSKKINHHTENDDYLKISSAQDCTGLIPSGIHNEAELSSYEELYPFLPKAAAPADKDKKD